MGRTSTLIFVLVGPEIGPADLDLDVDQSEVGAHQQNVGLVPVWYVFGSNTNVLTP